MKYGVKIWNYKGLGIHGWCDWSPFSPDKRWSEDINVAYIVLNDVERRASRFKYSVEEYNEGDQ